MKSMEVTFGVEISEEEVRNWLRTINIQQEEITDEDYIEYAENKYCQGLGCSARIL